MKLGTLLLRDAVITLGQLEEALRAQVLFGGRLGTNLVELGSIDLDTLGRSLAQVFGVPLATQARFDAASPAAVAALPVAVADEHLAFPLGPEPRSPEVLAVAMAEPRQPRIDALASALGGFVAPYVAPELRILYYLERRYGVRRTARYLRAADRAPGVERRRTRPRTSVPGAVRFEPRAVRQATAPPAPAARPEPRVSYVAACDAIEQAGHRDQIADGLLRYCFGRFAVAVLFLARDGGAVGWQSLGGDGETTGAVQHVAAPLGAASALQVAHDSGAPYRGGAVSAGSPVERHLWRELGVDPAPGEMLVVPVVVKKRVVNLLYVHGFAAGALPDDRCEALAELVVRASDAYVRLIQAAKRGDP